METFTIPEIKKLLSLTRRELRSEQDNVWPLFRDTAELESIEQKLLYEYNTRPI